MSEGEREGEALRRIREASLELAWTQGYGAASVEEIAALAGVQREEFDRLFASKEDCALAVFESFIGDFNRFVDGAYEAEEAWPDSLRAAAYAVADWMREHPREVRFGAVDMLWAGELAQAQREKAFQRFVHMIDAGRAFSPDPALVPEAAAERAIGSMAAMITKRVQKGEADPYSYIPQLLYLAVLPYLGEEAAKRELSAPRPSPRDQS